jgi:hypothetical protein
MAANISNDIGTWSVTAGDNQPDSGDTADIQSDLQAIQSAVKKIRAIGADIASASTVNLAAATGDFVTVTGTTTGKVVTSTAGTFTEANMVVGNLGSIYQVVTFTFNSASGFTVTSDADPGLLNPA